MTESTQLIAVTSNSEKRLTDRQLVDYQDHREPYVEWLLTFRKNPDRVEGYAESTAQNHAYRTDRFYRWVLTQECGYTLELTHDHGDRWLTEIAYEDCSDAHRAKVYQSLLALYEWLEEVRGLETWDPVISHYKRNSTTQPRDFLTREERTAILEAALRYGSIPAYGDCSPEERDRWKTYLAQRFEKPIEEVTPADWDRANGWEDFLARLGQPGRRPSAHRGQPSRGPVGRRRQRRAANPEGASSKNREIGDN